MLPNTSQPKQNHQLIAVRKAEALSQKELAEKIGVGIKTVQRWEAGQAFPQEYWLNKLCEFFGKTKADLGFVKENVIVEAENVVLQTQNLALPSTPPQSNGEDAEVTQTEAQEVPLDVISQQTTHFPLEEHINLSEQAPDQAIVKGSIQAELCAQDQKDRSLLFNVLHKRYKDKLQELEEHRCGKDFISLELHERFDLTDLKSGQPQRFRYRERALPEETTIVTLYDQVIRGLLILGKPGAGKTTLLYRLASVLLKRAEQDESIPLPVVLNLSSWAQEQLPLTVWVVKELAVSYHIPKKLGQQWVEGRFQLLLDALDEVAADARSACIEAINIYQRESLMPFVVCSREEEYLHIDDPVALAVQSTVIVQPLTFEQIDTYLVDPSLVPLREELRTNATFCDLLKTPLMLNTAVMVYQGKAPEQLPKGSTTVTLKQQMFTYYLHQMLLGLEEQAQMRMRKQLQWLARQMQQHTLSVFYLAQLQPDWLPEGGLRWLYVWLGVRLPGILIGFLLTCLINSFFLRYGISDLLVHSLPGAIVGGLLSTRYAAQSGRSRLQKRNSPLALLRNALLLGGALAVVLIFIDVSTNSPFSFFGGLIFGMCSLLLTLLLPPQQRSSHRGYFPTLQLTSIGKYLWSYLLPVNPWRDGLLIGLLTGLSWGLIRALTDGLHEGIIAGMNFALVYTVSGILIGSALRKQTMKVPLVEMIDPSLRKFWRSLINRKHFNHILLVGIGTWLVFGLGYVLNSTLQYGLGYQLVYGGSFGAIHASGAVVNYWLLIGLFQSFSRDTMPDEKLSYIPNKGIQRSGRNGLYLGLIGGSISAFIAGITIIVNLWFTNTYLMELYINGLYWIGIDGFYSGLLTGFVTFLTAGIVIGLVKGGMTWWRHWILRFLLWSDCLIPWHYGDLLEEACRYNLLSKEGREGYRFSHALFQEYCASLDIDEDQEYASGV